MKRAPQKGKTARLSGWEVEKRIHPNTEREEFAMRASNATAETVRVLVGAIANDRLRDLLVEISLERLNPEASPGARLRSALGTTLLALSAARLWARGCIALPLEAGPKLSNHAASAL
jgi:hypothetical protein